MFSKDGNLIKSNHNFGFQRVKEFSRGAKVLYYAGPHRTDINSKWRQTWTAPWYGSHKTRKYTVKIIDNNSKGYDMNRLKLLSFKNDELIPYPKYTQFQKSNEINRYILKLVIQVCIICHSHEIKPCTCLQTCN